MLRDSSDENGSEGEMMLHSTADFSIPRRMQRQTMPHPLKLTSDEKANIVASKTIGLPKAVKLILPLQLGEQYCNTSVRGLLHLFLQARTNASHETAKLQVHFFGALIYASPFLAGLVADLSLGSFVTGLLSGIILLSGMTSLSLISLDDVSSSVWLSISLGLIGLGLGGLKPTLQALASQEVELNYKEQDNTTSNLKHYFQSMFIWANIGILSASLLAPLLTGIGCESHDQCYPLGFGVATLVICVALTMFLVGDYQTNFVPKPVHTNKEDLQKLIQFFIMCLPLSFFWMLYDQGSTAWQDQYENMSKDWAGFEIKTELMANTGSILLLLFIPLLIYVVDPWLNKRNLSLQGVPRMAVAFVILIFAFAFSTYNQYYVQFYSYFSYISKKEGRVVECLGCFSGIWQLPQWILLALAEALLGTATPQFAHCQGGVRFRSLGPGLLLLTNAIGNILVVIFDTFLFSQYSPFIKMLGYIIIACIANLAFILLYIFWYRHLPSSTQYSALPSLD